jgi:hypothetical protein
VFFLKRLASIGCNLIIAATIAGLCCAGSGCSRKGMPRPCSGPGPSEHTLEQYRAGLAVLRERGDRVKIVVRKVRAVERVDMRSKTRQGLPNVPWDALDDSVSSAKARGEYCLQATGSFLGVPVVEDGGVEPGRLSLSSVAEAGSWAYFQYSLIGGLSSFSTFGVLLEQRDGEWTVVAYDLIELGDFRR